MEQITAWIKQIVAVIIIAGFLEMILPDNRLKGVTKLVMGLLIIGIMIGPIMAVFHLSTNSAKTFANMAVSSPDDSKTRALIERGVKLREEWNGVFRQDYEAVIIKKIDQALSASGYGRLAQCKLNFNGDKVAKAVLTLTPSGETRPSVMETAQVIRLVSVVTDLTEKQIEVIWRVGK